ncbi:desiccation-related protein PCC13-62-like [Bidens hawaiensis]|uniref:desiccation-related protein PCC13-62-like n=1 Tax=Bidens hawaiensis TaxID=980011 RepID=UPI00404A53AF
MKTLNLLFRSPPPFATIIFLFISTTAHATFCQPPKTDGDLLEFPLNLEYFEAEYFLFGSMGQGLDSIEKGLAAGGPPPIGAKQAKLSPVIKDIITQFGYQEIGHLKAIKKAIKGFPRPLLNLTAQSFATVIDSAFGKPLSPPFDPYANDVNYLISSYVIPYVGLTGYVGANPKLQNPDSRKLVAGLLGVESGQDAVIRTLLYERANETVAPYKISVSEFTNKISQLRDKLGKDGVKDEGLKVPIELGPEKKTEGNVLAGNQESLSYGRTPEEILRIVYGTGDERKPGGFYPKGGDGAIAKKYLKS